MMRYLIFIIIGIAFLQTSFAQQNPYYSNYHFNKYIINPGVAGSENVSVARLVVKSYFMGFGEKNPGTQSLSLHTRMDQYGLGVQLVNDTYGNTRKTGIGITYAYHLQLGEPMLAFGLTPRFYQFSINQENYFYFDNNDEIISKAREGKIVFDADFGAFLYADNYTAGFSVCNLLQANLDFGNSGSGENRMLRNYLIFADYTWESSDEFHLTPSALVDINMVTSYVDIGVKAFIKNMVWAGVSYKTINSMSIMAGLKYNDYYIGYAFDYSLNPISGYSAGTHEIMLGVNFGNTDSNARL
jgi:type IX secretion system PorP/SprF family membrane protein